MCQAVRLLVKALLEYEVYKQKISPKPKTISKLIVRWKDGLLLKVDAPIEALRSLVEDITAFKPTAKTDAAQFSRNIRESLTRDLNQFLGILEDNRDEEIDRGQGYWRFTLKLWHQVELENAEEDITRNLQELDRFWESKRSPQSAAQVATTNIPEGRPESSGEVVAAGVRENARLRGFNDVRSVTVWEGREVLLAELGQKVRDGLKVLAITGQGGIGKSSLATKLMEALGVNFQSAGLRGDCGYFGVVYFRVQLGMSFDDGAGQLLRYLGEEEQDLVKPQEKIDKIITYLAGQKWLLVLDNLEDILHPASHEAAGRAVSAEWGQLLNGLVYKNHQSQVIITSREMPVDLGDLRYKVKPDSSLVETVALSGVSVEAGVKILQSQLKDKLEDLHWMAERVGGSVFLLNQLIALGKGKPGYLRKNPKLVTKNAEPMLREQLNRQSAAAQDFLARMSILRGAVNSRGLTFVRLFVDEWQERLMAAAAVNQPLEFSDDEIDETEKLLEKLVDSSLVESKFDEEKLEDVYSLHQVTKDFLGKQLQQLPDLFIKVNDFYRTEFTFGNFNGIDDFQILVIPVLFALNIGDQKEANNLSEKMLKYTIRLGQGNLFENAMMQDPQMAEGSNQTEGYLAFGQMHYELGNWDEAERLFLAALERATLEDRSSISTLKEWLGSIARNRGDWDEAERLYKQSLALRIELGYQYGIAFSWEQLGGIANYRGNWDEAESFYAQSLELRTELGDRSGMATSWGVLGDVERMRGNFDAAEDYKRQSFQIRQELGDQDGMAMSLCAWGEIKHWRKDFEAAEELYLRSLEIRRKLGNKSGVAIVQGCLGANKVSQNKLEEAEELLVEALVTMESLSMSFEIAEAKYAFARLERKRSNLDLAQQHYITATTIFQNLGAAKDLERIQQEWSIPPSPP